MTRSIAAESGMGVTAGSIRCLFSQPAGPPTADRLWLGAIKKTSLTCSPAMPSQPTKFTPKQEAVESVLRHRLLMDSEPDPGIAAEAADDNRQPSRGPFVMRIISNLTEHLRTLRSLTATRIRLRQMNDDISNLNSGVGRLASEMQRKVDQNEENINSYRLRIADYRDEIVSLANMADAQRQSYIEITRRLATGDRWEAGAPEADDPFMQLFEREMRDIANGTRDEVRSRLRFYLPYLDFLTERKDPTIVDLGSGRGEWLELVRETGRSVTAVFPAHAAPEIPLDDGMVTLVSTDTLAWLRERPDRSVDIMTAFQVLDRMPLDAAVMWLKEVVRVLRSGGKVILEMANPESLLVGAYKFWLDPGHVRPLPPLLMEQLMGSLAFDTVDVMRLHPDGRAAEFHDRDGVPRALSELIAGCDDYAIVATLK